MSHAITPTDRGRAPLTRKAEVLQVLAAGGRTGPGHRGDLLELFDRNGRPVPAWQNAIKGALAQCEGYEIDEDVDD